jgi:hypothetical protein
VRRGEARLLAAALAARGLLGAGRFVGSPERFANREEAHNATAAWLFAQGHLLGDLALVQYRSFCGGCSIVALSGAPFMLGGDELWRWKLLALAWTAAMQAVGFFVLRALVAPAAAWAWMLLWMVPPIGALDLSLMLWGNHQESGLFVLLALLAHAHRRPLALGLALGFGVYFARTSAYSALVLLPLGLAGGLRSGLTTLVGFAAGAAPVFLPAGGGDAGWYRFAGALLPSADRLGERAENLFLPGLLGARAWLPLRHATALGGLWLAGAVVSAALLTRWRVARVIVALCLAWTFAYCFTSFPIFLVNSRAPVNNIRYHAPWLLLLALLLSAGLGAAWARGWRRSAGALAAVLTLVNLAALLPQLQPPRPGWSELDGADPAGFVTTVAARFHDAERLDALAASDAPADRLVARLRGITVARRGGVLPEGEAAQSGYGEALLAPCATDSTIFANLAGVPDRERHAVGRGMGLTLSFCERSAEAEAALLTRLDAEASCAACSLGARRLLDHCGGPAARDVEASGACLRSALVGETGTMGGELAYGVGRAWAEAGRSAAERQRFLSAFAAAPTLHASVALGMQDIAAGSRQPALARDRSLPVGPPPR